MLPEFIRFCVVLVLFLALVTGFAVLLAYVFGNTEAFNEEEDTDEPWGKNITIRETD